jgi:hypothetical protein
VIDVETVKFIAMLNDMAKRSSFGILPFSQICPKNEGKALFFDDSKCMNDEGWDRAPFQLVDSITVKMELSIPGPMRYSYQIDKLHPYVSSGKTSGYAAYAMVMEGENVAPPYVEVILYEGESWVSFCVVNGEWFYDSHGTLTEDTK